jgi:predicted dehydrogenase
MAAPINVAIIGLDTSHSVEFARRLNAPDCPEDQRVSGMTVGRCLRFETPFQNQDGLNQRQKQMEAWGVAVTERFEEAIVGCDAIMLEINDPAYHLEYFRKVAALGKPVFLDKPLAGTIEDGRAILNLARQHGTRVWSGSSIPFTEELLQAVKSIPEVTVGHAFGAMGTAPAGDSLVWYGVHAFEMLQRLMGTGAEQVWAIENEVGVVAVVDYPNKRRGMVEAIRGMWSYGGRVQCQKQTIPFICDSRFAYRNLLLEVRAFFQGGPAPVAMETTFEGLAIMLAARKSIQSGRAEPVAHIDG